VSPYLFTRNISEAILAVVNIRIWFNIGGIVVNILVYVDDLVLMAPSWIALQEFTRNSRVEYNVCMVFKQTCQSRIVGSYFPNILFNNQPLQFSSVLISWLYNLQ